MAFLRHYSSANTMVNHGLGPGWSSSWHVQLSWTAETEYQLIQSDGRRIVFTADAASSKAGEKARFKAIHPGDGYLTRTEGTIRWQLTDGRVFTFSAEKNKQLQRIDHPGGRYHTLSYEDNRLTQVEDSRGSILAMHYYGEPGLNDYDSKISAAEQARREATARAAAGQLKRLELPNGDNIRYRYDTNGNLIQVRYPDGRRRQYQYANEAYPHVLTGINDTQGKSLGRWGYDDTGRANHYARIGNINRIDLVYDLPNTAGGTGTTTLTNSLGEQSTYTWQHAIHNNQPLLLETSGPGCGTCPESNVRYEYSERGEVLAIYRAGGNTHFEYDEEGRKTAEYQQSQSGNRRLIAQYEYEGHSSRAIAIKRPSVAEGNLFTTTFSYLPNGMVSSITEQGYSPTAPGEGETEGTYQKITRVIQLKYNKSGQIVLLDGPRKDVEDHTKFVYHSTAGSLYQINAADGSLVYQADEYDAFGRGLNGKLGTGETYALTYNDAGVVDSVTKGSVTQRYHYDNDRLAQIQFSDGSQVNYHYDWAGRLVKFVDEQGEGIRRTYNSEDQVTRFELLGIGEEVLTWVDNQYDQSGQLLTSQSKNKDPISFEYDNLGRINKLFTEQEELIIEPTWLATGHIKALDIGNEEVVRFNYNTQGEVGSIADGNRNLTQYRYDDFKRVVSRTSPDTGQEWFVFDTADNLISHTNALSQTRQYQYDARNQLIDRTDDVAAGQFSYAQGKLTQATSPTQSQQHEYDSHSRLIKSDITVDGHSFERQYRYNERGQLARKKLTNGDWLNYEYDSFGRLVKLELEYDYVFHQTLYHQEMADQQPGRRSIQYGNGSQRELVYDGEKIKRIDSGEFHSEYAFDGVGRLVSQSGGEREKRYQYDSQSRLVAETARDNTGSEKTLRYDYDAAGNRTQRQVNDLAEVHAYARSNRQQDPENTYVYNEAGSLLEDGRYQYRYTPRQQVSQVYEDGRLLAEYQYNLWGERSKKTVYSAEKNQPQITYYLYEAKRLVAEADEKGNITRQYFYLNQPQEDWSEAEVRRRLHVQQADQTLGQESSEQGRQWDRVNTQLELGGAASITRDPLAISDAANGERKSYAIAELDNHQHQYDQLSGLDQTGDIDWYRGEQALFASRTTKRLGGDTYWIHTDHLGTPQQMQNEDQKMVWQAEHDAYANTHVVTSRETLNIRLPGQYYDEETGSHYNYHRYYNPRTGRYTTADPLDLEGGINRYSYAKNNPLSVIDPTGEQPQAVVIPPVVIAAFYACGAVIAAKLLTEVLGQALAVDFLRIPYIWPTEVREGLLSEIANPSDVQTCPTGQCQTAQNEFEDITPEDVAAMSPDELTACHNASQARNKDHPCYGGTCSAEHYDNLDTIDQVCKPKPRRCRSGDSCESMNARILLFNSCANVRRTLADTCFKGGDPGHINEWIGNFDEANICVGMLPTCR